MGRESVDGPDNREKGRKKEYAFNRYHSFEAEGRCPLCGRAPAEGKKLCEACAEKCLRNSRRLRESRAMAGLCPYCGGIMPEEGMTMCGACAERNREYTKKIHGERKLNGLCAQCGLPVAEGSVSLCEKHLTLNRGLRKERRFQRIKDGLCMYCGKPLEPERDDTACGECRRKQKEYRQRRKGENAKMVQLG